MSIFLRPDLFLENYSNSFTFRAIVLIAFVHVFVSNASNAVLLFLLSDTFYPIHSSKNSSVPCEQHIL